MAALRSGTWDELPALVRRLGPKAMPEADLRHLEVLRGFLLDDANPGVVIEYESSPGVGAVLAEFPLG